MRRAGVAPLMAAALLAGGAGCQHEDRFGLPRPDFLVIGHRGAPNLAAENTIASLEAAMSVGANAVEVDLCVTADRQIALWHDGDPDDRIARFRQRGLEGLAFRPVVPAAGSPLRRPVETLTLDELRASHGYARSGGTPDPRHVIPTATDLFAWAARTPALRRIYLDVKLADPHTALATHLLEELDRLHATSGAAHVELVFMSPRRSIVDAMAQGRAALTPARHRVAWDFEDRNALEGAEQAGLRDVTMGMVPFRSESDVMDEVERLVNARWDGRIDSVTVWTIDRRSQMALLLYLGVDGVMTNEPGELAGMWRQTL